MFDGNVAVAWCEYGTREELPYIYNHKEYEAGPDRLPDYPLTCFFVDKDYRRNGMVGVALDGAEDLIAQAGFSYGRGRSRAFRPPRSMT